MILDNLALAKIIADRPHKRLITAAQEYAKKLLMHVKGLNLDQYIERVLQFERPEIVAVRKKYAVSNKAMFNRINRPTDKVFSAKGGSCYYNLDEAPTKKMKDYCSNVVDGLTLKNWLKTFWMPAIGYDPMGVILMELSPEGNPYPTYKSIMDIYEYQLKGRDLEYIIFKLPNKNGALTTNQMNAEPNQQGKGDERLLHAVAEGAGTAAELYRVIDDVSDRIVKVTMTSVVDVPDETYPNYWMEVPASIISNIYDPVLSMFVSSEDALIDLADQFLREGSTFNIVKNYHGFPQAWQYSSDCPECHGTGTLSGDVCQYCKGSKVKSRTFPEETMMIPVPQTNDQPKLAPDVAGYIVPPIEGMKFLRDELEALEDIMYETKWGTHQADDTKKGGSETATGKYIDTQPIYDKLNEYSDAAEMMETFITDKIGQILIGKSYKGASISYGRRFLMETPDAIWTKLQAAFVAGAPTAALYDLYDDYLQARYSANAMELSRMQKLARVEPLPWVKFADFGRLQTFPDIILRRKACFGDWLCSKEPPEILLKTVQVLRADFEAFFKASDTALNAQIQLNPLLNEEATPPEPPIGGAPAPNSKTKIAA